MNRSTPLLTSILCLSLLHLTAQTPDDRIRLNQIGYYPTGPKVAVVTGAADKSFFITRTSDEKPLFKGKLGEPKQSAYNPVTTREADFTSFTMTGEFVLRVPGTGVSYPFTIKEQVHLPLLKAAIKSYYYQRFSIPLESRYAGRWSRPANYPQQVVIHPSAASPDRPAGTPVPSPRGWIDAGDYNKYIVNSGITTATLLMAYDDTESLFRTLALDIPESGNTLPDLLDEVLWNLRWMLTMQDPADGGVYHKCTNAEFDAMVMPDQTTATRYMVQKSTAAALDFAAVTARAARVYSRFSTQVPGLADSCRSAALRAWAWAKSHPAVIYDQDKLNREHDPDINTGTYGDGNISDEWLWAAAEVSVLTGNEEYLARLELFPRGSDPVPAWNDVRMLAYYTLSKDGNGEVKQQARSRIIAKADELLAGLNDSPWHAVMGGSGRSSDFVWGSNAVAANQGMLLLKANQLTGNLAYRQAAMANLDYLLGRNASGYSFVTGYGSKTPMHIHHRPSEADGIVNPVPGLLAGGPNPGRQDKCNYATTHPDDAYTDDVCSYASNEVAINWNAPLVYVVGVVENLKTTK